MQIKSIENNQGVELFALIQDAQVRTARNGSQYLSLTFSDPTGTIGANLWDVTAEQVADFLPGRVVYLTGQGSSYQDKLQLTLQTLRLATAEEPSDPSLYVARVEISEADLKAGLRPFFAAIQTPVYRTIVSTLLGAAGERFFTQPAAKQNHHALVGGLAWHTLSILRLAQSVSQLYAGINTDLLYAGILLHDYGKLVELSGPVATQYTTAGNLLGHISIVDGEIVQACLANQLDPNDDQVVLLRHLILAHHGRLEYGSPVKPQLLEAQILHQLDDLDASIVEVQQALAEVQPGEFSPRIFALDNRKFYQPTQPE